MPNFQVDFSDAPEFKTPNPGLYVGTVRNAKLGESKSGTAKVTLQIQLTSVADENMANEEFVGQNVFDHLVLGGRGAWKTREALSALLGYVPGPDDELDTSDLIEESCLVEIVVEIWAEDQGGDGEPQAKVAHYKRVGL